MNIIWAMFITKSSYENDKFLNEMSEEYKQNTKQHVKY